MLVAAIHRRRKRIFADLRGVWTGGPLRKKNPVSSESSAGWANFRPSAFQPQ